MCDGKRCVGVGSVPVLANALSILCGCNSVVSYSGDGKDSRPFPSKTKKKRCFIYTDLARLVNGGVESEPSFFCVSLCVIGLFGAGRLLSRVTVEK